MDLQFWVSSAYYLTIALLATLVAYFSVHIGNAKTAVVNRNNLVDATKINMPLLVLSALIILLPLIFTDKGTDRNTYITYLFQELTWDRVFNIQNQEPGFMLINYTLKTVFGTNKYVTLTFFYSLMVFNVFFVIYNLKDSISVPFAVFIFSIVYTIQSISLLRVYVAGSILLVASYYMLQNKNIKSLFLFMFAISIHYSSAVFVLLYLLYCCLNVFKDKYSIKILYVLLVLLLILILFVTLIPLIKDLPIIARYQYYFENITLNSIGLMQPTLYIPLIILSVYLVHLYGESKEDNLFIAGIFSCFFVGILSYMMTILGRCFALFMYPFVIGFPYLFKQAYNRSVVCKNNSKLLKQDESILFNQLILVFLIGYIMFKFLIYMTEYIALDGIGILPVK